MPPSQAGPDKTEHPQDKGDPRQQTSKTKTSKTGDAQARDRPRHRTAETEPLLRSQAMRVPPMRWHHGPWGPERGPKRVRAGRGTQGGA